MPKTKRCSLRHAFAFLLLAIGAGFAGSLRAEEPYGPTSEEALLLPEYCRPGLSKERQEAWGRTLGTGCRGLNHYCYALNWINRAKKKPGDRGYRNHALANALGDNGYTINASTDKCPLAPDFHIVNGDIYLVRGETPEALSSYLKATQLRPDYPKGWLALSDLYKRIGQLDRAREALQKGLEASPEKYKDYMRKRLAELEAESKSVETPPEPEKPTGK